MKNLTALAGLFFFIFGAHGQEMLPKAEKHRLRNALEILFIEYGSIPATSFTVYVNAGGKSETPGLQAISALTANTLLLGNNRYSRMRQDSIFENLGTSVSAAVNDNFTTIATQFLNRDVEMGVELLSLILREPVFPEEEILQEKNQMLDFNTPSKMDIGELAGAYSAHVVFGSEHPLGRQFYAAQLQKLNRQSVVDFYKFNYTPENTRIVVCGKLDRDKLKGLLEKHFGSWKAPLQDFNSASYYLAPIKKKEYYFVNRNGATQAAMQWNKPAPAGKDIIPFHLANIIFNKKLFEQIRAKEGKTYGIRSILPEAENNGIYTITTQVRPEVAFETIQSLERVMSEFQQSGITHGELASAKKQLIGHFRAIEAPLAIAQIYNPFLYPDSEKRRIIQSEIDQTNLETVNRVIRKFFEPESYKLVIVGDETLLLPQLDLIKGLRKLELNVIETDQ